MRLAISELARLAAEDLRSAPDAAEHRTLGLVPREGDASEALAEALAVELTRLGQTVSSTTDTRAACAAAGIPWAQAGEVGVREQAIAMGEIGADGLILIRASSRAGADRMQIVTAEMTLTDPSQLGFPWSFEGEVEAAAAAANPMKTWWREHPGQVIAVIGGLVLVWLVSTLRRRSKSA